MTGEVQPSRRKLRSENLRARLARWDLAHLYGLFAVLVVASVQLFFSLWKGGFFVEQWFWGVGIIMAAVLGAALVPGYLSSTSVGRMQWALVGTLLLLLAVVAASILWSIAPDLSILEASRTAMYVGVFVLLLPAAARWGSLIVDATIFGALLPPAIYGLLQKIVPTSVQYTGFLELETDAKVSSTLGYHATFGMTCAMGALLVAGRTGSLRSLPLRALYSATGVLFLVALYFSFSRGALLAIVVGTMVLLFLAEHRFEVLGNLAVTVLPALWVVSQAQDYPGLVARPVSLEVMESDGLALFGWLLIGVLLALAFQVLFTVLIRVFVRFTSESILRAAKIVGTVVAASAISGAVFLGWGTFQELGGFGGLRDQVMSADTDAERESISADQTQRFSSLSTSRPELWKIAWENWREHPFTGTGGDTYGVIYEEKAPEYLEDVLHPHSIWLSLLSDTGIFAFLSFAAFCVGCLVLACYNAFFGTSSRKSRALIAGSMAAASAYLVSSSIDWNWYIPASTLPFFALAAVAAGMTHRQREQSTGPKEP